MLIDPEVTTRHYIDGVEVITPRGVSQRIPEVYDKTARKWLLQTTAPLPVAVLRERGRGEMFWNAEEALDYIRQVLAKNKEREALGFVPRGRPRTK